jgi:hypothetical protein
VNRVEVSFVGVEVTAQPLQIADGILPVACAVVMATALEFARAALIKGCFGLLRHAAGRFDDVADAAAGDQDTLAGLSATALTEVRQGML